MTVEELARGVQAMDVACTAVKSCDEGDGIDLEYLRGEDLVLAVRQWGSELVDALAEAVGPEETVARLAGAVDSRGNTAMHMCAANGDEACISRVGALCPSLLSQANAEGNTPLHWACVSGHLGAVRTLHGTFGAVTAVENAFQRTPICEAQQHARVAILEYFVDALGRSEACALNVDADDL